MARSGELQDFLDAAFVAFDRAAQDPRSRQSLLRMAASLATPQPERQDIARRLPVCDLHLEGVLAARTGQSSLDRVVERFKALEPLLEWRSRTADDGSAGEDFAAGHANAMIVGPGALENRRDMWLGATLMAPHVRYPDHDHAPEETYLVLSDGEFMHGDSGWFAPGIGGSFYNPPGIRHAMRSGDKPLFALWALLPDQPRH